ncbi:MAG: hypothetical protein ACWGO1_09345, partial [Anaerolineales bacterium]
AASCSRPSKLPCVRSARTSARMRRSSSTTSAKRAATSVMTRSAASTSSSSATTPTWCEACWLPP